VVLLINVLGGDKMFGLGMQELIVILVIVLIIFGAGKLPDVGRSLGEGIRNFKKGLNTDAAADKKKLEDKQQPIDPNNL
jgi:sec-independent protein translocase protein TatA